jgi:hypothetical protein
VRQLVCPYCERRFWIEEQPVFGHKAGRAEGAAKTNEIQLAGWHESSVVRGYAAEQPSIYKRAIQLEAVNTADGARRRFEIWERSKADAHGYLLTINGWTAQGRSRKKDFKIGKKGLFTVNKGDGRDGKSWTKLSAFELEKRKHKNGTLIIDKGSEEKSEGWLLIRLSEPKPVLLDEKGQLNESLVKEMIQAWAICWDPEYLS